MTYEVARRALALLVKYGGERPSLAGLQRAVASSEWRADPELSDYWVDARFACLVRADGHCVEVGVSLPEGVGGWPAHLLN